MIIAFIAGALVLGIGIIVGAAIASMGYNQRNSDG